MWVCNCLHHPKKNEHVLLEGRRWALALVGFKLSDLPATIDPAPVGSHVFPTKLSNP